MSHRYDNILILFLIFILYFMNYTGRKLSIFEAILNIVSVSLFKHTKPYFSCSILYCIDLFLNFEEVFKNMLLLLFLL
jgi:K+-sensing histidine kinase KdpD